MLVATAAVLFASRRDVDVLVLRQPGTLYVALPGGDFANFYNVQVLNRTGQPAAFEIEVIEPTGATMTALGPLGPVAPHSVLDGRFLLPRLPLGADGAEHTCPRPDSFAWTGGSDYRVGLPWSGLPGSMKGGTSKRGGEKTEKRR